MWPFSDFQFVYRSSRPIEDLLTAQSRGTAKVLTGNSLIWPLNLNLTYKTPWSGKICGLLTSILGKLNLIHLIFQITLALFSYNKMGLSLKKNNLLTCWDWRSHKLNWDSETAFIVENVSENIRPMILSKKILLPQVSIHLYKSNIWPCFEYCFNDCAVAPMC